LLYNTKEIPEGPCVASRCSRTKENTPILQGEESPKRDKEIPGTMKASKADWHLGLWSKDLAVSVAVVKKPISEILESVKKQERATG